MKGGKTNKSTPKMAIKELLKRKHRKVKHLTNTRY